MKLKTAVVGDVTEIRAAKYKTITDVVRMFGLPTAEIAKVRDAVDFFPSTEMADCFGASSKAVAFTF